MTPHKARFTTKMQVPAVVLGLSPTGLYAVRELAQAGVRVVGVAAEFQAGCWSRYLDSCIVEKDEERRLEALMSYFSDESLFPVLIPTSDQDVDFIIRYADQLSRRFVFQDSYTDGLAEIMLTKERFYKVCEENGVAFPKLWKSNPNELSALKEIIIYPCMIKPSRIHEIKAELAGEKGWIVNSRDEFDKVASKIPLHAGTLLLQEIIPGPESEITLFTAHFCRDGNIKQPFTAQKLRQYPPGFGSASLVRSHQEDDSQQIAESLLQRIGYKGIAAAEFKRDFRDGLTKIIEINARPSLWFSVSSAAGKKVTLAAYHELADTGYDLEETQQINDVHWRYFAKDIYSSLFYRLNPDFILPSPDVSSYSNSAKRLSAVFTFKDPLPVFAEIINFVKKSFRSILLIGKVRAKEQQ